MTLIPEIQQAEQLDAAGNHDGAIDQLAVGTRKGDIEAATRLGKRLLIGDRAPFMPKEGVGFLVEAAGKGGAEALSRLAVLAAIGIYLQQNWQTAVEGLTASAERGWQEARGQLLALAADRELARQVQEVGVRAPVDSWRRLAAAIDMNAWLVPPPAEVLNADPLIRAYPGFATRPVCDWLIGKAQGRLQRAKLYDALRREDVTNSTRTNTYASFNLLETDLVNVLVQGRMAACLQMPFRHMEAATVLHYAPGEQITEHFDFVDPGVPDYANEIARNGQRVVTFLLYLNEGYENGQTAFPKLGIEHKGRLGEGMFFVNALPDGSSDLRTLHAGRPPVNGEKWIVSQFVRNRPAF